MPPKNNIKKDNKTPLKLVAENETQNNKAINLSSGRDKVNSEIVIAEIKNLNPFVEVAAKKLRKLRKIKLKIDKLQVDMKADKNMELNDDQKNLLDKRASIVGAINELEDLVKQFVALSSETSKDKEFEIKEEKKELTATQLSYPIIEFLSAYSSVNFNTHPHITEKDRAQLDKFAELILSHKSEIDFGSSIKHHLENLSLKSDIQFEPENKNSYTYSKISEIGSIINSSIANIPGNSFRFTKPEIKTILQESNEPKIITEIVVPPGGFKFRTISKSDVKKAKPASYNHLEIENELRAEQEALKKRSQMKNSQNGRSYNGHK